MVRTLGAYSTVLALIFVMAATQSQTSAAAGATAGSSLMIAAPAGFCRLDAKAAAAAIPTGFTDGVKDASALAELYVPCDALAEAQAGARRWLPEWVAYEVNVILKADEAGDGRTATTAGLCDIARRGHPVVEGIDFSRQVEAAQRLISPARPVVYFGVVAEDIGACYLATLKADVSPAGEHMRYLTVTAFMIAGKQWVYLSRREHSPGAATADAVLGAARVDAKAFLAANGE